MHSSHCVHYRRAYRERYLAEVPRDESVFESIAMNAARIYNQLPNTPVRTAYLRDLTLGVPCRQAATTLGISPSCISRASNSTDRQFVEYLRQLGFSRATRAESHRYLLDWLSDDKNCPYPSGGNARCYTGSASLMWAEYATASLAKSIPPLHFDVFEKVRSRERVQTRSGDIFINRDEVELAELREIVEEDSTLSAQHEKRIAELENNLKFCKERKKLYREAHQALKGDSKKMIVTIDFTGTQTGMQDKFHSFVVVICTDQPLQIPPQLADSIIQPEAPEALKKVEKPLLEKEARKTKAETKQQGGGRKLLPSFAQYKTKKSREPRNPQREKQPDQYTPSSTVFHFVLRRGDDTPGQISPYVQWSMDFLFEVHDLAGDFEEVHLFSDGCGKHFKTYPTHWYDSAYIYIFCAIGSQAVGTWQIFNSTSEREKSRIATAIIITTEEFCSLRSFEFIGISCLLVMLIIDAMLLLRTGRIHRRNSFATSVF